MCLVYSSTMLNSSRTIKGARITLHVVWKVEPKSQSAGSLTRDSYSDGRPTITAWRRVICVNCTAS